MPKRLMLKICGLLMLLSLSVLALPLRAQDTIKCDLKTESDYVSRGDTEQSSGDHEAAISDYSCALELNASNTDALFGRGYSYQALGDDDRAERDYTNLLELDPQNGAAYNNRGNIYYSRDEYDRARADYDRAIELDNSDLSIPYGNRGSLNYDEGNYEAALEDLNNAIELAPSYRSPYLTRAFVYQAMGEDQKAMKDIQNWIEFGETRRIDLDMADFTSGDTFEMSEGWVYHIPIEADPGQTLRVAAKGEGEPVLDPLIVLLDSEGAPVAWNDDTENSLDSLLKFKFPEGGSYELLITHAGGGSEGEFRLLLELVSKGA